MNLALIRFLWLRVLRTRLHTKSGCVEKKKKKKSMSYKSLSTRECVWIVESFRKYCREHQTSCESEEKRIQCVFSGNRHLALIELLLDCRFHLNECICIVESWGGLRHRRLKILNIDPILPFAPLTVQQYLYISKIVAMRDTIQRNLIISHQ